MKVLLKLLVISLLALTGVVSACEQGTKLPYDKMIDQMYNNGYEVTYSGTAMKPMTLFTRYQKSNGDWAVVLTSPNGISVCGHVGKAPKKAKKEMFL